MILDEETNTGTVEVTMTKTLVLQHWNDGKVDEPGLPGITYPSVDYKDQVRILLNDERIAIEDETTLASYARTVAEITKRALPTEGTISIAILGLGTGFIPRMLAHGERYSITVYEIEPTIITWFSENVAPLYPDLNITIVEGDAQQTLADSTFDVLVDDINGTPFNQTTLLAHVNPGGVLIHNMKVIHKQ